MGPVHEHGPIFLNIFMSRIIFLILCSWIGIAHANLPDLTLKGSLQGNDHQSYVKLPFTVPVQTQRITIDFSYTGKQDRSVIDLGLIGPDGKVLGWSGGNKSSFTISALDATPSYSTTPIYPGEWQLLLGVPNMRANAQSDFKADIYFSKSLSVNDEPHLLSKPLVNKPGWYRGDLHSHTAHSDGSCQRLDKAERVPCPVFVTAMAAAKRGLDFMAITDHNTVSQANSVREIQPYFNPLLLMVAREVTTFFGHANVFGTRSDLNFQIDHTEKSWNRILSEVESQKALISINHPVRPSGELCMGCGWNTLSNMEQVHAIEVVNGGDIDTAFSGVPFWHEQLNKGYRITGISGSDNHLPDQDDHLVPGAVGVPITAVFANALSEIEIVKGIREGNVFIDLTASKNKMLEFTASNSDNDRVVMGQTLNVQAGSEVKLKVMVKNAANTYLHWWVDGVSVPMGFGHNINSNDQTIEIQRQFDGKPHWIRVDVKDTNGKTILIGNPIYIR
jgi:hypothetical protein